MAQRHIIDVQRLRKSAPRDYTPKTGEEQASYDLRKTFMGEDLPPRAYKTGVNWGRNLELQLVGTNESVAYASNKWGKKKEFEEFKHVSESKQKLFAAPGALPGRPYGPVWRPSDDVVLPTTCAELSVLLFLEGRLFVGEDEEGNGVLGQGDEGCSRIRPAGCLLYGAYLGDKGRSGYGEPCLLVISKTAGLQFLITGSGLDITRDGIIG